jgi:hypothetical protein
VKRKKGVFMRKLWLFCMVLFAFTAFSAIAQEEPISSDVSSRPTVRRTFYIDIGLGLGGVSYFGDTGKFVDTVSNTAKSHITLDMSLLTMGWAVTQNLYIVGTINGFWDSFFGSYNNQSRVTVTMYGLGTRYYPFGRFLQLGLDVGASQMRKSYEDDFVEFEDDSDFGFGAKVSAGFDFDPSPTGFTGILGGSLMLNVIENEPVLAYMVTFKLAYKAGRTAKSNKKNKAE